MMVGQSVMKCVTDVMMMMMMLSDCAISLPDIRFKSVASGFEVKQS